MRVGFASVQQQVAPELSALHAGRHVELLEEQLNIDVVSDRHRACHAG